MEVPQPLPKFSVFVPCPLFYTLATIPPPDYFLFINGLSLSLSNAPNNPKVIKITKIKLKTYPIVSIQQRYKKIITNPTLISNKKQVVFHILDMNPNSPVRFRYY